MVTGLVSVLNYLSITAYIPNISFALDGSRDLIILLTSDSVTFLKLIASCIVLTGQIFMRAFIVQ